MVTGSVMYEGKVVLKKKKGWGGGAFIMGYIVVRITGDMGCFWWLLGPEDGIFILSFHIFINIYQLEVNNGALRERKREKGEGG